MSKLEYLNPADWSLHVIDGENEAVHEGWIQVPNGMEYFYRACDGEFSFWKDGKQYYDKTGFRTPQESNLEDWISDWNAELLWQRESKSEVVEDVVNQPSHYNKGGIECIDAIESSMTKEAFCGYLKGNVQKYMWRYENKGGVESLKKAQWYLNKLIEVEGK